MQASSSIISLHIGQAGIQTGSSVWQLFSLEHSLNPQQAPIISDENIQANFSENHGDNLQSRAIFIDLEPTAIDDLMSGYSRTLHRSQNLISGKGNIESNYATGYYTAGKDMLEQIMDKIRKQVERYSQLQGFMVYRSLGGGTGSGLGSLIAQNLSVSYGKKTKIGMNIYPSPQDSQYCIEPYNTLLSTHANLQHLDVSMVFDNSAIKEICRRSLDIQRPAFLNMNGVIAQVTSSITTGIRFNGLLNSNLSQFTTNLVPFPRVNSTLLSYSSIVQASQGHSHQISVSPMTEQVLQPANILAKCDPAIGKYLAMTLNYRGDVRSKDISAAIGTVKTRSSIRFVDWTTTGLKIGIERSPPVYLPRSGMAALPISCCAIFNNTVVSHLFGRLAHKFDLLHSKQAFLQSYTSQGMQLSSFTEARQDIEALLSDYEQIQQQQPDQAQG